MNETAAAPPSPSPTDVERTLVGGLALVPALSGQLTLTVALGWLWLGLILGGLALLLFVWGVTREPPAQSVRLVAGLRLSHAALLVSMAALFSALAGTTSALACRLASLDPLPTSVVIAVRERGDELRIGARLHPGGDFDNGLDCRRLASLAYHNP